MRVSFVTLISVAWIAQAEAVTMNEAISKCYSDGRRWCPNLGHGSKMQNCLNQHFKQLSTGCQSIVIRLNQGETISLF
jgi:hypothetical protein